jgi:hypothetical protein
LAASVKLAATATFVLPAKAFTLVSRNAAAPTSGHEETAVSHWFNPYPLIAMVIGAVLALDRTMRREAAGVIFPLRLGIARSEHYEAALA